MKKDSCLFLILCVVFFSILKTGIAFSQVNSSSVSALKKMSLEELMNIEVISVSKSSKKLSEVASAIQVITNEDIRRSGARRLPGALRLAPNLQVAQFNAHDWAISARGFNGAPLSNNTLANKLLVMIDGRSVYTPLFGGVFWDIQNALLEDIDRIEVVSGPGGTLWGANAVNGVINILSKEARETQGFYATGALGTFLQDHVAMRYGGSVGSKVHYRTYVQVFRFRNTFRADTAFVDDWNMIQGGFRMDYRPTERNLITVQGDLYKGEENVPVNTRINGQNLLARWTHTFSENSALTIQGYFDRRWRLLINDDEFSDELRTFDIEFEHSFSIGKRNKILWGGGHRYIEDEINNSLGASFFPQEKELILYTAFVQDQIAIISDELELTLGSKFLSYTYADFEIQPSVRIAWTPNEKHTLWAAVSRAVRTPSRFDVELVIPGLTTLDNVFTSENVVAYEVGYRVEPLKVVSISSAIFYNKYTDLRSINFNPEPPPGFIFGNDLEAKTWGLEIAANYWIKDWWRLRGGYTFIDQRFSYTDTTVFEETEFFEAIDPEHQAMLQSILDIKENFQVDVVMCYVDFLPETPLTPRVSSYFTMDIRLAYLYKNIEVALVGQNLFEKRHVEFGSSQIPISMYGRITVRL